MRVSSRGAAWLWVVVCALGLATVARAAGNTPERDWVAKLEQGCPGGQPGTTCRLVGTFRQKVFDNIYHYTFQLRVGSGTYDVISVHRVVREENAFVPSPSARSVFLVHGDVWGFQGAFMSNVESTAVPGSQSFAFYLAKRGVDVWGIDLRWVAIPPYEDTFTFMKDWNLGTHAQDLGVGVGMARLLRMLGGQGAGQMPLLGWSRGAAVSYAYLNMEAQWSADKRQVSGFIPVDMAYVLAPDATAQRDAACTGYTQLALLQASGVYEGGKIGQLLQALGSIAKSAPNYPSPFVAGYSNRQAALVAGAATHVLQGLPVFQGYHFTGGTFQGALPNGLKWTREAFFLDTLEQASPFQSIGEQVDTLALWCGAPNVPYDDYLSKVTVPVMYIGAAGGVGRYGLYSLLKLGSKDLSVHIVQRLDDTQRAQDYGHQDLFTASDAEVQVWSRVADWLSRH